VGLDFASEFLPEGTTGFREGQLAVEAAVDQMDQQLKFQAAMLSR